VFTNILCPVDFSPDSERALAVALSLARSAEGHLTILTVVDPLLQAGANAAGVDAALDRQTQAELQTLLERSALGRPLASMPAVAVAVGKAGEKIIEQARECNADIIVMGMRGIGSAARLFLGSTSEYVLKLAEVPVLVVPPSRRNG
jgi:nucleotide-binding universal stress UspA family protein